MSRTQTIRLLFALLLTVLPFLLNSRPAWALQIRDTIYYAEPAKINEVGETYSNPCTEEFWSWGTTSPYRTVFTEGCIPHP